MEKGLILLVVMFIAYGIFFRLIYINWKKGTKHKKEIQRLKKEKEILKDL